MISRDVFTEDYIRALQLKYHRDPSLIERTIYAFGLLEALVKTGLKFAFKGGTSLMLLLPRPMRLSTDIDIIVDPGTDIEDYIEKARVIFPFIDAGEQERESKGSIEKRHFRFKYDSQVNRNEQMYILLDVLFEENPYECVIKKEINNYLLLTEGKNLFVIMPTIDCLLGDKLTAFAPHTTGIKFGKKNLEIMKQFYDISNLIEYCSDFECIRKTFLSVSKTEIAYRNIDCNPEIALMDTISSAICIGSRGRYRPEEFSNYLEGTRRITNHIFDLNFSMEKASRMAPKVIYLAACILTDTPFESINDLNLYRNERITQTDLLTLKGFRKIDLTGFGYLVKADRLLLKYREQTEL